MIQLALESGSSRADKVVAPAYREFNRALEQFAGARYCDSVDRFLIGLRASGEINDFGFEGVDAVRRNKKGRYIFGDIGIPEARWKELAPAQFREYLVEQVRAALQAFVRKLAKDREPVDEARLFADYTRAAEEFRKT